MAFTVRLAVIISITLWASAFVGIREALTGYSPEGLALLRYLIASIIMAFVYFRLPARMAVSPKDIFMLLFIGVLGIGVYNIALNHGELVLGSGVTSFITSQSPIIATIIAVLFLGETLNLARVAGFLVSFLGVALIAHSVFGPFHWNASMSYILLATLSGSCYTIMQKPYLKKYHVIQATTYVMWGGTLFLLLYLPNLFQDFHTASYRSTLTVIYLGVFPAALGYLSWSYVLSRIPVSRAVSFLYVLPVVTTALGWLFLGEKPTVVGLMGGLLTMLGVYIINQSYQRALSLATA